MRRCITFLLALLLLVSMAFPTWALEPDISDVQIPEEIDSIRVENAFVDISSFSSEALFYVELFVSQDDDGNYYIRNTEALRELLTEEQYALVEEQIRLTSTYSEATTYAATGTEGNPYELDQGISASVVTSNEYWFSCTIAGVPYFRMESTQNSTHITYRKTLFGKTQLTYNYGTITIKSIKYDAACTGTNTYLIQYIPEGNGTLTCTARQHIDNYTSSLGARWDWNTSSAVPSTGYIYLSKWYVPKENIVHICDIVESDAYLDYQTDIVNGSLTAAAIVAGLVNAPVGVVVSVGAFVVSKFSNFQELVTSQLKSTADANNDGIYENDVLLTRVMINDIIYYFVYTWNGSTMTGATGSAGTWTINDFDQ